MDIFDFLLSNWWITLIILIVFTGWAVRNIMLIKVNPTFAPTNLDSEKSIDLDTFRFYQKELTDLGFKHEGDFNLYCMAGMLEQMSLNETFSIFIDKARTTIAYISKDPNSAQKEFLEFSTDFHDGRQVNSSNSKKMGTVDQPLPTVTTRHYPRCSATDLWEFHQKNILEFSGISKPEPVPGNIMEKKVAETRKRYEYNLEKGIFIKSKSGEHYKIALPVLLKSFFRGFRDLLARLIPDSDKGKTYGTGFQDSDARELFKGKKTIKLIFGLYFLFPFFAVGYKFFFMLPDFIGYFIIFWFTAFMAFGYGAFIALPPGKKVIYLELVYFTITGISTYILLWTNVFTTFSIFFIFLLIGMIITFSGIQKKKIAEKTAVSIVSAILLLMVISLFNGFRLTGFIHSFRHLDAEEVREICIYGYDRNWGEPFSFSEVEPELEIRDQAGLREFCSSVQDTSPYHPERGGIKGEYVVRLGKTDGSFILFTLGQEDSTNYPVALIGFVKENCLKTGRYSGPGCNQDYQSKELLSFLRELKLKKWTSIEDSPSLRDD